MQIDPTNNNPRIATGELREVKKTAEPGQSNAAPAASAQFKASATQDTSQDINLSRVNEIRQAISEGRLEIKADRIADGLIASTRELLSDQ